MNDVDVRDAKGELAPETKYYRVLRGKPDASTKPAREKTGAASAAQGPRQPRPAITLSSTGFMLKPGDSREEDINVSKLYDLSKPGRYAISEMASTEDNWMVVSRWLVMPMRRSWWNAGGGDAPAGMDGEIEPAR